MLPRDRVTVRSGPNLSHPPFDPWPTRTAEPYMPTAVTYPATGLPSTITQVCSNRDPSPASPPVTTTPAGTAALIPRTSSDPLTSRPSLSTKIARSPGSASPRPMALPATNELPSVIGSATTRTVVAWNSMTATDRVPSATSCPWISPDVEHPSSAPPTPTARSRIGSVSSRYRGAPKQSVSERFGSTSGRGPDHPDVRSKRSVLTRKCASQALQGVSAVLPT